MEVGNFTEGMRKLAASVCLITTTRTNGERYGLTATPVCSLSTTPPMLLVCLNCSSHSYGAISEARRFCVNVLPVDDAAVAHHFSGDRPAAEKFQAGSWRTEVTGSPVLASALAAFDCRLGQVIHAGTHAIMIGQVEAVLLGEDDHRPLLYAQGGYGRFTEEDAQSALANS